MSFVILLKSLSQDICAKDIITIPHNITKKSLLEKSPNIKASIQLRENIILPLITIQQYALMQVKAIEKGDKKGAKWKDAYEKMIIRAFFGSINASRNAA